MKRLYKITALLFILLNLCLPVLSVSASRTPDSTNTETYIKQTIDYKIKHENTGSVQKLLDTTFSDNPGNGVTETYLLSLRGYYKGLDYSGYLSKLTESLKDEEQWSTIQAPSFQKHALVFTALNEENPLLSYAKENTLGKDGIMSYIYGLFLMNANSKETATTFYEELIQGLLKYQLQDGGFAYSGKEGDVDVTAYALQALAPYVEFDEKTNQAVEKALQFLSDAQLEEGDFASYGTASCESTAQVILALCALNIDYTSDERFIKNYNTVKDGLVRYQLEDGSFAHTISGKSNDMSTAQCLSALIALYRQESNQSFLYSYGEEGYDTEAIQYTGSIGISYKWILTGVIVLLTVFYVLFFARKNKKRILTTFVIAFLLLLVSWMIQIQSTDSYYGKGQTEDVTAKVKVTISIRCDTVAGKDDFIPKDGVILPLETVTVAEGDTVFDVLKKVTAEHKIQMEFKDSSYIEGIGFLYEQKFGELSGWMYKVNGNFQSVGAGQYEVDKEDEIEWVYTCNLGKDVGDSYNE